MVALNAESASLHRVAKNLPGQHVFNVFRQIVILIKLPLLNQAPRQQLAHLRIQSGMPGLQISVRVHAALAVESIVAEHNVRFSDRWSRQSVKLSNLQPIQSEP